MVAPACLTVMTLQVLETKPQLTSLQLACKCSPLGDSVHVDYWVFHTIFRDKQTDKQKVNLNKQMINCVLVREGGSTKPPEPIACLNILFNYCITATTTTPLCKSKLVNIEADYTLKRTDFWLALGVLCHDHFNLPFWTIQFSNHNHHTYNSAKTSEQNNCEQEWDKNTLTYILTLLLELMTYITIQ